MLGLDFETPTNSYEDFVEGLLRRSDSEAGGERPSTEGLGSPDVLVETKTLSLTKQDREPLNLRWPVEFTVADAVASWVKQLAEMGDLVKLGGWGVFEYRRRPTSASVMVPDYGDEPGPFGPVDEATIDLTITVEDGTFPGAD